MSGFCNSQVHQCCFHCLLYTLFQFDTEFLLLLLFECGGVSGKPVIKNHAPLWEQPPLLWLNVDSTPSTMRHTSHIACQPHCFLNPNQLVVWDSSQLHVHSCFMLTMPPCSHAGNIFSQSGGRWELRCFPAGLCRECHSREGVWWWASLDQRVSGCFVARV